MRHDIVITYCQPCGYLERAESAAAVIRRQLGFTSELVAGQGGIFQVAVAGKVVARRTPVHFPLEAEITDAVARAMA